MLRTGNVQQWERELCLFWGWAGRYPTDDLWRSDLKHFITTLCIVFRWSSVTQDIFIEEVYSDQSPTQSSIVYLTEIQCLHRFNRVTGAALRSTDKLFQLYSLIITSILFLFEDWLYIKLHCMWWNVKLCNLHGVNYYVICVFDIAVNVIFS